ncbi:MAG: 2-hydroxyacid dehydrogenase [Cyclobacteriaceae bacterium]
MHIALIAPGRNLDSWERAFHLLDSDISLEIWPDISNPEPIELAVLWNHPEGILSDFPNLRLISSMGAGVDHILKDPYLPRHIPIMKVMDKQLKDAMSNYLIMAVLNYQRNSHEHLSNQKREIWEPGLAYKFSLNIGFLGMGILARDAARKLFGLGFAIRGYTLSSKDVTGIELYHGSGQLSEFLADLDILVNLLPLTDATRNILDRRLFNMFTKPALLINAARGEHLVEADLLDALNNGQISKAYLDVFNEEPLPHNHPFWRHSDIFVTPHIAAITNPKIAVKLILENYLRTQNHQELRHLVDIEKQY